MREGSSTTPRLVIIIQFFLIESSVVGEEETVASVACTASVASAVAAPLTAKLADLDFELLTPGP